VTFSQRDHIPHDIRRGIELGDWRNGSCEGDTADQYPERRAWGDHGEWQLQNVEVMDAESFPCVFSQKSTFSRI
jgi:hypothetical protein